MPDFDIIYGKLRFDQTYLLVDFMLNILSADKEGTKALQMSYNDRLKLVALTKQISYGKFKVDIAPDVGILDVIGNDRR